MARQRTTSQSLISIVPAALVALGLVILFGKLDEPAARLMTSFAGAAASAPSGPGDLAGSAGLCLRSPAVFSVPPPDAGVTLAATPCCSRSGIVARCFHGKVKACQEYFKKKLVFLRSGWQVKNRELASHASVARGSGARSRCSRVQERAGSWRSEEHT